MTKRESMRRASFFRQRARELVEKAKTVRDACDRRHLLDLAAMYERSADQMAARQTTETELIFRPR